MLSETLSEGLKVYGIGAKVRALRLKKSMGLVALGEHTGLSPAMLSKIERGRLYPTLPTLLRIAMVFSVGLEYFFEGQREKPAVAVVRKKDRLRLPEKAPVEDVSYHFESLDFPVPERRLNGYLAEFVEPASGRVRAHQHPGGELIYVLRGSLMVQVGDEAHVLASGDSMYFDSSVPHTYRRAGSKPCEALVVSAP
jgi:transcriptional regulator with XRE-family HTH domain